MLAALAFRLKKFLRIRRRRSFPFVVWRAPRAVVWSLGNYRGSVNNAASLTSLIPLQQMIGIKQKKLTVPYPEDILTFVDFLKQSVETSVVCVPPLTNCQIEPGRA
jgi:hypothetical protein